mgnify:CR=1 FL=1
MVVVKVNYLQKCFHWYIQHGRERRSLSRRRHIQAGTDSHMHSPHHTTLADRPTYKRTISILVSSWVNYIQYIKHKWQKITLSEGYTFRRLHIPKVTLSEGYTFRRLHFPKVTLSEGYTFRRLLKFYNFRYTTYTNTFTLLFQWTFNACKKEQRRCSYKDDMKHSRKKVDEMFKICT